MVKHRDIEILGRKYRLIFQSLKRYCTKKKTYLGFCDPPTVEHPCIRVEKTLTGIERMEIIIHEMIHGADWHKDEDSFVAPLAADIAKVLTADGYRRQDGDS